MSFLESVNIKQVDEGKSMLEKNHYKNSLDSIDEETKEEYPYQTGDLILFYGKGWISKIIQFFTGSKYSHIAIVLKDPTFIYENMKGLYVLEANYPTSKSKSTIRKVLNGVQIAPFSDIFHRDEVVYWEKLDCERDLAFYQKIKDLHRKIHHLPYDINPMDWIKAELFIISGKQVGKVQKEDTFFCSALVGYVYNKLGFMDNDIDWSQLSPKFFVDSIDSPKFKNCKLYHEKYITEF